MHSKIIIKGAREHNLKNVSLEIPRDKLVVFTGVSGSGKSTLAFDTLFAEGQRRYLESLSAYARQFLGQMRKPDVDHIDGLSPTISIDQKTASHNPRSTVGTVTEIHDYLRLLFAKIGKPQCPTCNTEISALTIDQMMDRILDGSNVESADPRPLQINVFAPVVRGRKGEYLKFLQDFYERGFTKARVNGILYELGSAPRPSLARYKKHTIEILVDFLELNAENLTRLTEALETAIKIADGLVMVESEKQHFQFNTKNSCPHCSFAFPELEPRIFSFNSPYGACETCNGLGSKKEISTRLMMPDLSKTIDEGGVLPWSYRGKSWFGAMIRAVAMKYQISLNTRLKDIPESKRNILLFGEEEPVRIKMQYHSSSDGTGMPARLASRANIAAQNDTSGRGVAGGWSFHFSGLVKLLQERYKKTESEAVRNDIEHYMDTVLCGICGGTRYRKESLSVFIQEKNIADLSALSITDALYFFEHLKITSREKMIVERVLREIQDRLRFLSSVGLGYLSLNRAANTLAGGEAQRIRLASQVGSGLMGVLYILDEPSIGLHARDNDRLITTLEHLRDLGNTVIVIEHDEEMMRRADWIVDIGHGAGKHGGEIIAQGTPDEVSKNIRSLTGKYLSKKEKIEIPFKRRKLKGKFVSIYGASEHNLKNINVHFPLGVFTCVTGVSGSGKSTLVNDILYKALARKLHRTIDQPGTHAKIEGWEELNKIIVIDQSPIGRTPRSNSATYTGVFTPIRELFTSTKTAKVRGYGPGRFSFNVRGGRCEACQGEGFLRIEMQFLPDVFVPCDVCHGKRYARETLEVKYKEKNIAEVLSMTVEEAYEFFKPIHHISWVLRILNEVGLGYIELGQSATTLSGGEAQRVKLASELSKRATGNTIYILDEPTTGLHFADVAKLLEMLYRLTEGGNTVIVIEHNLDVIKCADHVIDLGPEGGDAGGQVLVSGTPEDIAKNWKISYTGTFLRHTLKK